MPKPPSLFEKYTSLQNSFSQLTENGQRNPFAVLIERPLSSTVGIIEGRETLLFGTNNYLGLSQCPESIEAAIEAARIFGVGTTGSRIANGTFSLHKKLELALAAYFNRKHCLVFSTGYQANLGTISALAGKDDYLFLDADCHASIYDGSRLGQAQVIRFRHNDADDLYKRLKRVENEPGARLVVTEGIYSMMGDIVPIKEFVHVKHETGAALLVDEAHSFGVLGKHGRGVAEEAGVEDDIDFITGTFSKSFGTVGGYCISPHPEVELIRLSSRPYMFTASLPTEIIAATLASLRVIAEKPELRQKLKDNSAQLFNGLREAGLQTGEQISPVVSVVLEDIPQAVAFWNKLLENGVYVNLSLPPATPDRHPLLRSSVSAAHTPEQISKTISIFKEIAKSLS
ncbi:serine palmitoyltransferase [Entomobacter blattae]|uniref:8-amino-7-oxononanoate synthase n=1 Tax=Entomobacter blattae TaxID=2762277 RepID=A0A7H1NP98_9PROT|nr:aminotransferase class I/II-fold pyridoxal phosphate-dependent enzyme [Entomobacter blattae]QNT77608.1 8-amino-7-oxononanoate synthase [Entomobacter blattae]